MNIGHCEDCELNGDETPATQQWDVPGYPKLCDECAERRIDAHEPDSHDVSAGERMAEAYAVDRSQK